MNLLKKFFAFAAIFTMTLSVPVFAVVEKTDGFYVADYANVIERDTEQYIIKSGKALYDATGAQIVVVTVDFLDGMEIEDYAYELFNDWGIGDKDKNNGLLLLLTIGEQNYWATVGDGIRYDLDAGTLDDILYYNLEPDFAVGDYDSGVRKVYDKFYEWFEDFYGVQPGETERNYTYQTRQPTQQNDNREPDYGNSDYNYEYQPVTRASLFWKLIKLILVLSIILYIVAKFAKKVEHATGQDNYYNGDGNTNNNFFFFNGGYNRRPPMGGWNPPPPPPPRPPRPPRPPKPPRSGGGFGGFGGFGGGGGFGGSGGAGRGGSSGGGGSTRGGGAGRR